jgi:serine/threonine-protein kinase RsbW
LMETLRLPARMESLEIFRLFVLGKLRQFNLSQELVFKVELVLEEVLTNVIHYAYPEEAGEVEVGCAIEGHDKFCFCVTDWGIPFNPLERPDPELCEDLTERHVGGLGIYLVRHLADQLRYRRQEGGNLLTFCFDLQPISPQGPWKPTRQYHEK